MKDCARHIAFNPIIIIFQILIFLKMIGLSVVVLYPQALSVGDRFLARIHPRG